MTIDVGDLLIVLGTALLLWGLYLVDYRAAIIGGGTLLMLAGMVRLRKVAARRSIQQ